MKRIFLSSFILGLMLLLVSCETTVNRDNAAKIKTGMTKDEVLAVMGEPIKGERYCMPDVFFYYTDCEWHDGMITRDECTPIVFEKGKVVGVGRAFYKDYRQKDWK
ncbi:MAG: hypothetical protein A2X45_06945 [Lentisphaerae bacterium GWF2_50_93]|nr:MAG: hypothetical protein A2X45_06945 [Lentisphaerae bacterium GWF2_50_93]